MVDGFHVGGANNAWNYMGDGCVSPIGWWSCGRRSREGKWSRIARKVHSLENRPLDSSTEDEGEVFGGPRCVPKWMPALTRVRATHQKNRPSLATKGTQKGPLRAGRCA